MKPAATTRPYWRSPGDMPRKMQGTDFIQTTEPDLLFRDVSLYTETISSPAQAPAVIHQAIAAAYARPRRRPSDAAAGRHRGEGATAASRASPP